MAKKNCTKGKACGGSCIASGKTCRGGKAAKQKTSRAKAGVKKARQNRAFDRAMGGSIPSGNGSKRKRRASRKRR